MLINGNVLKKTLAYYFVGALSLILSNLIFSISFYFINMILFSLIIQYFFVNYIRYILYTYFKIFNNLRLKNYIIILIIFFVINNLFLNFVTIKNIYFSQFTYTVLVSLIGFPIMNKLMK